MSLAKPLYTPPKQEKTEVHIVPDIETLALTHDAVVMSIGLVAFTLVGGEVGSTFILPDQDEQRQFGRRVDPDTAQWWNGADKEGARRQFEGPLSSIMMTHSLIRTFINRFETRMTTVAGVWGFGSDFDNATLFSLCATHTKSDKGAAPWPYKKNRCGRTLTAMYPNVPRPENRGVHHNALDDARWQAEWFRRCMFEHNACQQRSFNR